MKARRLGKNKFFRTPSLIILFGLILLGGIILPATKSNASTLPTYKITSTLPSSYFDGNGGDLPGLVDGHIGEACKDYPDDCPAGHGTSQLQSPITYIKLYFKHPNLIVNQNDLSDPANHFEEFTLFNDFSLNGTDDDNPWPDLLKHIKVDFYATNSKEKRIANCDQKRVMDDINFQGSGWSVPYRLKFDHDDDNQNGCTPQQSQFTGYYTVELVIQFDDEAQNYKKYWNNSFNFKVQAFCSYDQSQGRNVGACSSGGAQNGQNDKTNLAGLWAQVFREDQPIALESQDYHHINPPDPCDNLPGSDIYKANCYDIWIGFGAPCKPPTGNPPINMEWKDADAATSDHPPPPSGGTHQGIPTNPNIYWDLYVSTDGNNWSLKHHMGPDNDSDGRDRGGNNDVRTYQISNITVTPGTKFMWHWGGIMKNNDPQVWIPWDSANYNLDCNQVPQWDLTADLGPATNGSCPPIVAPGQNCSFAAWIKNSSSIQKNDIPASLVVQDENSIGGSKPPDTNPINSNNRDYQSGPADNCKEDYDDDANDIHLHSPDRSPCWWWQYNANKLDGRQTSANVTVTIPNAPAGTQYCFRAYAHPENDNQAEYIGTIHLCYTIGVGTKPYLSTAGGDVHAGIDHFDDSPCFTAANQQNEQNGTITGQVNNQAGSTSTYVVSAGAAITSFLSANGGGALNGATLTFGNQNAAGYYGSICRTDVAKTLLKDAPPGGNFTGTAQLNTAGRHIYYAGDKNTVQDVTLSAITIQNGRANTLVVNGDVYLTGDIGFNGTNYASLANIPSLSIIATGDIFIDHSVANLYGIYVAGSKLVPHNGVDSGQINTCSDGFFHQPGPWNPAITTSGGATLCNNPLKVNGALIALGYYFRRTFGDLNSTIGDCQTPGTNASECIYLIPQLLLNSPPGISGLTSQLLYEGERAPIY